jgi:carbonic anhydrase
MISARDAIERLRDGNQRFTTNLRSLDPLVNDTPRAELANEQHPFAIILGCSDSRVPPEIIFDQGLGALLSFVLLETSRRPLRLAALRSQRRNSTHAW